MSSGASASSGADLPDDIANRMSLFYANPTPMLNTLSGATSRLLQEVTRPNPRRACRREGYCNHSCLSVGLSVCLLVCLSVCLSVCSLHDSKSKGATNVLVILNTLRGDQTTCLLGWVHLLQLWSGTEHAQ